MRFTRSPLWKTPSWFSDCMAAVGLPGASVIRVKNGVFNTHTGIGRLSSTGLLVASTQIYIGNYSIIFSTYDRN